MTYQLLIRRKDYASLGLEVKELNTELSKNQKQITEIFKYAVLLDDREAIDTIIKNAPNYFTLVENFECKMSFKRVPNGANETMLYHHKLAVDIVIHYSPKPEEVLKMLPINAGMLFPSTLHEAAFNGEEEKVDKALKEIDINCNTSGIRFITLVNYAAAGKNLNIVQNIRVWVQKSKFAIMHRNQESEFYYFTPLHIAVNQGNQPLIKVMIQDLSFSYCFAGPEKLSPLTMVVITGSIDKVQRYFDILYKKHVFFTNENYQKDARSALLFGTAEVVLLFLKKGVNMVDVKSVISEIEKDDAVSEKINLLRGYVRLYHEATEGKLDQVCKIIKEIPELVKIQFLCRSQQDSYYTVPLLHSVASRDAFAEGKLEAICFLKDKIGIDVKDYWGKRAVEYLTNKDLGRVKYMLQSPLEKLLGFLFADKAAFQLIKDILGANKGLGINNPIQLDFMVESQREDDDGKIKKVESAKLDTSQLRDFIINSIENINSFRQFSCGLLQADIAEKLTDLNNVLKTPVAMAQSEFDFLEPCEILSADERTKLQQVLHNLRYIVECMFKINRNENKLPVVVEKLQPDEIKAKEPTVPALPPVATAPAAELSVTAFFASTPVHRF